MQYMGACLGHCGMYKLMNNIYYSVTSIGIELGYRDITMYVQKLMSTNLYSLVLFIIIIIL